ncbi:MAG: hypothetical protein FD172_3944, partial [Methylocystaceae bacterium]
QPTGDGPVLQPQEPKTKRSDSQPAKLAYRISEAVLTSGLARSTLYELIASGRLKSVKIGGRRLISADSLKELLSGAG